ncbi:MAG: DJ-1/PfpI family protein [Lachnospiraceae bacterium]|nr:DJ-1/PfpI family protein [Lachnospiraceae bacterium]MBQ4275785.1 DJ-1/PfpI family protein [Lachnospiraceae bacterium]
MEGDIMKTAIFLATGFEEIEALTVVDMLRRAKLQCDMVSVDGEKTAKGSHGIEVAADLCISEVDFNEYDCLVLPGGAPGFKNLEANQYLMNKLDAFYAKGKLICAICGAPSIFGHRGYLQDKTAVVYPGMEDELKGANVVFDSVVKDGNIITSRGMGTAIDFAGEIIATLLDEETKDALLKGIVYTS